MHIVKFHTQKHHFDPRADIHIVIFLQLENPQKTNMLWKRQQDQGHMDEDLRLLLKQTKLFKK